jgi:ABC-type sulfate transport system permease component
MLTESAAPYTLVGIMFLIAYARQSQVANAFGQVYAKLAVSPYALLYVA